MMLSEYKREIEALTFDYEELIVIKRECGRIIRAINKNLPEYPEHKEKKKID